MSFVPCAVLVGGLGIGLAAIAAPPATATCGTALDAKTRLLAVAPGWQVAFAPRPAPLAAGRHFSVELVVCPRAEAARVASVRVDADMPAHRHGMNYAAQVTALGGDRHRADGLMFHMPGRWRFLFDLTLEDGRTVRLMREVDVP